MNNKIIIPSTMAAMVAVAIIAAIIMTSVQTGERTATAQTQQQQQNINFTKMLEQRAAGDHSLFLNVRLEYQSPKTVVLQGPVEEIIPSSLKPATSGLTAEPVGNQILWQFVDSIKGYGYTISAVTTTGTILQTYHIIMSHP